MSDACPAVVRTEGYHLLWGKAREGGGSEHGLGLHCCVSKMCWQASQLLAATLGVGEGPGVVSPGLAMAQGVITK